MEPVGVTMIQVWDEPLHLHRWARQSLERLISGNLRGYRETVALTTCRKHNAGSTQPFIVGLASRANASLCCRRWILVPRLS